MADDYKGWLLKVGDIPTELGFILWLLTASPNYPTFLSGSRKMTSPSQLVHVTIIGIRAVETLLPKPKDELIIIHWSDASIYRQSWRTLTH